MFRAMECQPPPYFRSLSASAASSLAQYSATICVSSMLRTSFSLYTEKISAHCVNYNIFSGPGKISV